MKESSGIPTSDGHKVVVIGLDGATLDLVGPLMEQGVMPNLRRIIDSGSHGRLNSTLPVLTAPAWSSFFTGKNPGKHGLYCFWGPLREGNVRLLNDSRSIKAQALWDIIAPHGKTVGMLNVPMTYPVPKVNGYAIAGLLSPRQDETFAYPLEMLPFIADDGPYVIDIEPGKYIERGEIREMLGDLLSVTKRRLELASKLVRTYPVDLFMVVFVTPDRIQHTLWHILDPSHPLHDEKESREHLPRIQECYRLVDRAIGELVEAAGPSSATIVMSDHGFGQLATHLDTEAWLKSIGLLSYRRGFWAARQAVGLAHVGDFASRCRRYLAGEGEKKTAEERRMRESTVDWSNTQAFRADAAGYGIYLNVRGREPFGTVEPGDEYRRLQELIMSKLRQLRDPSSGQTVVEEIYRPEELYTGEYLDGAPDVVASLKKGYKAGTPYYLSQVFCPARRDRWGTGCHRQDGMIALAGPDISASTEPISAEIIDVAPTILYLLGVPIPKDIDGRVLTECLKPDLLSSRPPEIVEAASNATSSVVKERAYSEEEEEQVGERLRNLGYLD